MTISKNEGSNIHKAVNLLINCNLSNYEISKHTHISQSTLGNYKRGKTMPTPANAEILLQYFTNGNTKERSYDTDEAVPIFPEHVMLVPLVNQYAYAGYLSGYADTEYIESLPTIPFIVDHEALGHYLSFEVKGDSMNDGTEESLLEGDRLLCREIQRHLWQEAKLHYRKWDFVIVHREGILVKRIVDHNVEAGTITIHSLNTIYPDREIRVNDIYQIFNVIEYNRPRRR